MDRIHWILGRVILNTCRENTVVWDRKAEVCEFLSDLKITDLNPWTSSKRKSQTVAHPGVFSKHPVISVFGVSQNVTYFILITLKVVTAEQKPCRRQRGVLARGSVREESRLYFMFTHQSCTNKSLFSPAVVRGRWDDPDTLSHGMNTRGGRAFSSSWHTAFLTPWWLGKQTWFGPCSESVEQKRHLFLKVNYNLKYIKIKYNHFFTDHQRV